MNTEPEQDEPTDEQLDAMLRDVLVPSDLKSRLKRIPELEPLGGESCSLLNTSSPAASTQTNSRKTPWLSYVLAASLLAVAAFTAAQFLPSDDSTVAPGHIASSGVSNPEKKNEPDLKHSIDHSTRQTLNHSFVESDIQKQELQLLQAQIHELEIASLESELLQLETLNNTRLSENEVESMIMALAPEYSVPLGGNKEDVRSEMARVIKEYPNTRGAVLANKVLKQIN